MTADEFIARLDGVRPRGTGRWSAKCVAHPDKYPSLSIREGERGVLLKCWAGCTVAEICAALNIRVSDLFTDAPTPRGSRPTPKPVNLDRVAIAFRYDLTGLDFRLRAERIIEAGKTLTIATMTDKELDQALDHVTRAHANTIRAEAFEHVADTLRMREFLERDHEQRQRIA